MRVRIETDHYIRPIWWSFVVIPSVCVDGRTYGFEIMFIWLFWSASIVFKRRT